MKKKIKKHCVTYSATKTELSKLQCVMKFHKRNSYTDTIRFLIETENEKILNKNIDMETK